MDFKRHALEINKTQVVKSSQFKDNGFQFLKINIYLDERYLVLENPNIPKILKPVKGTVKTY